MPMLETKATRALKKGTNGALSFYNKNVFYLHTLWVTVVTQPHEISGQRRQSMHQAHWYPRSYQPGNYTITIRCRTQEDYQRLSNLVRLHHTVMMSTPGLRFSGKANSVGLRHMMRLRIPSEAINVYGWIPNFTITKRGVFDPAPEYTFDFFPAHDPLSSDPLISYQIREYWNPNKMKPQKDPFTIDPDQGKPNRANDPLIRPNPIPGRGD